MKKHGTGERKGKRAKRRAAGWLILAMALLLFSPAMKAQADSGLKLNKASLTLYVGNDYQLEIVEGYEPQGNEGEWWWWFWVETPYYSSSNQDVVHVNQNGQVHAVGAGKATITVTYENMQAKCKVTVKENTCTISDTELTVYENQSVQLKLTCKKATNSFSSRVYTAGDWLEQAHWPVTVTEEGKGNYTLTGAEVGDYYVELIANAADGRSYSVFCTLHVKKVGLEQEEVALAVGKREKLTVVNAKNVAYESENPDIVTVNGSGEMKAVSEGEANIRVTYTDPMGQQRTERCRVHATDPVYVPPAGTLIAGNSYRPEFTGVSNYSSVTIESSDQNVIYPYDGGRACYVQSAGTTTLTIVVDGVKFKQKIKVIDPRLSSYYALLVKGKTKSLKVTGAEEDSVITYTSLDDSVAKVSKAGKITAKGTGSTRIKVQVDEAVMYCTVNVVSSSGKGVLAVQKGEKVLGALYSQEKRMQKGYYDCSSFVWRSYKEAGVELGGFSYAPTAAELAKKLESQGKAIAYEYVPATELKPGDLIFYAGGSNGRYKNIYHVAMYYSSYLYQDYWMGTYDSGLIIHASGDVHIREYSGYITGNIVMIARPYAK